MPAKRPKVTLAIAAASACSASGVRPAAGKPHDNSEASAGNDVGIRDLTADS